MELIDLIDLNKTDDDKIMLVDADTQEVILESSCLSYDVQKYYYKTIEYIGVSNDLGTNLLVFIDL